MDGAAAVDAKTRPQAAWKTALKPPAVSHNRPPASSKVSLMSQTVETTFERHYSVDELCEVWGMSDDFVRRLFLHEPGVVVFLHHRPGRRAYRTLRIPESVALRVHRRMSAVEGDGVVRQRR